MDIKSKSNYVRALMWLCIIIFCLYLTLHISLPGILSSFIFPEIAKKAGIDRFSCDVRRIGLCGSDFSSIKIGDKTRPGILIDSIKIDYSPIGIFRKNIKSLSFSGIKLFCDYEKGNLTIPGLYPLKSVTSGDVPTNNPRSLNLNAGFQINYVKVSNAFVYASIEGKNYKIPLEIESRSQKNKISCFSGILNASPSGCEVRVTSDVKINENIECRGSLFTRFQKIPDLFDLKADVYTPIDLTGNYRFDLSDNGQWNFEFKTRPSEKTEPGKSAGNFGFNEYVISTGSPAVFIFAKGISYNGIATYLITVPEIKAQNKQETLYLPALDVKGKIYWGNNEQEDLPLAAIGAESSNIEYMLGSTEAQISKISLFGHLINSEADKLNFRGEVTLYETAITDKPSEIKIRGIQAELPISLPCKDFSKSGNFSIKEILFAGKNCGSIKGSLKQIGPGIEFKGKHKSRLIPGFTINLSGITVMADSNNLLSEINFKAETFTPKSLIDLGQFIPSASGFKLHGSIKIDGDFSYNDSNIKSALKARLTDADLENPASKISIRGISADLHLTDLFGLKSAPAQSFKFKSANFGSIDLNDGWFEFQIESIDSIFIEKSSFNWCKGRVDTQGIRISENLNDYNIVLYCDRLHLASILDQFGAADAEGNGSVNGRIPVRYNKGRITFDNGFLFSTPGSGGRIKFRNAEKLTAGIPQDSTQYVQIELAREALKDFQYQWAKLGLNTENEDLLLNLEFDGKPTSPLLFVYQKDLGSFAKIEAGQKGSVFEGIKLNVNFRLPLDKVIQYKDVLKMLK